MLHKNTAMEEPIEELTIRLYPTSNEKGKEQVRKLCLIFGYLRPNEKKDSIVDVLYELSIAQKQERWLKREEIERSINENKIKKIGSSTIRRQLKKLTDGGIIEKEKAKYRIKSFLPIINAMTESHKEKFLKLITQAERINTP
jgi:predicted transcriptional regulator